MKKTTGIYIDLTVLVGADLKEAKPAALKVNSVIIKKIARCVTEELELGNCELSICLTDDAGIRELNLQYRDKDKATDVLSFPMDDESCGDGPGGALANSSDCADCIGARVLGDVAVSIQTARRQAESYGVGFYEEMARLLTHGILHLLGYDHVNGGRQAARMKRAEERLMAATAHLYTQ
ncbi:Metal-dependent hydrolase YbeY, involved in rRNA and/or ribosome maturation and assembly [hydrothermal vent metagenome]|uniref:Metal-dependent hydrolase YbeY, involved in rRNA and/or ribosome maturation and assembly n=1 Tax=hydrothermal vent metagenome TaxID=652676 RepID=A0A3B0QRV4_9ZZZZ